jgi:hypothetical protein
LIAITSAGWPAPLLELLLEDELLVELELVELLELEVLLELELVELVLELDELLLELGTGSPPPQAISDDDSNSEPAQRP